MMNMEFRRKLPEPREVMEMYPVTEEMRAQKAKNDEEIHRIFERFYKVDKSRSEHVKGVGLGLNLAQDIVELHGGDIYAESEPGGFTSFRFWIPIEKTTDPQE